MSEFSDVFLVALIELSMSHGFRGFGPGLYTYIVHTDILNSVVRGCKNSGCGS